MTEREKEKDIDMGLDLGDIDEIQNPSTAREVYLNIVGSGKVVPVYCLKDLLEVLAPVHCRRRCQPFALVRFVAMILVEDLQNLMKNLLSFFATLIKQMLFLLQVTVVKLMP